MFIARHLIRKSIILTIQYFSGHALLAVLNTK